MSNILKRRLQAQQPVYTEHPGTDALAAFVEHELKGAEREKLLVHLAACPACREAVSLAAPEMASETSAAQVAPGFSLAFPALMRWASAAAALAVAIGVGVLYVEHEPVSRKAAAVSPSPVQQTNAVVAQTDQAKTAPEPQNAAAIEKPVERKKTVLPKAEMVNGVLAANSARGSRPDTFETAGHVFAKKLSQPPMEVATQAAPGPPPDAYLDSAAAGPVNPPSQNGIAETRLIPSPPPPPAAPSAPIDTQNAGSLQRAPEHEDSSGAAVAGGAARAITPRASTPPPVLVTNEREEGMTLPPKSSTFVALGGPMKKPAIAVTELVSWTVTTAGKLQRQLRNGAVKFVEPAPGVIVRAIAARGIEVWAGGSQADLSTKQWRQVPALFHSSDAGETWAKVDGPWHSSINSLTLTAPGNLTVATQDGTWISRDAGKSWITENGRSF